MCRCSFLHMKCCRRACRRRAHGRRAPSSMQPSSVSPSSVSPRQAQRCRGAQSAQKVPSSQFPRPRSAVAARAALDVSAVAGRLGDLHLRRVGTSFLGPFLGPYLSSSVYSHATAALTLLLSSEKQGHSLFISTTWIDNYKLFF